MPRQTITDQFTYACFRKNEIKLNLKKEFCMKLQITNSYAMLFTCRVIIDSQRN